MKNILIVLGHPSKNSFNKKIADVYETSSKKAGYNVKRINLYDLKFDLVLHHGYNKKQSLEEDLLLSQDLILWADHIVFIYPIWWGSVPALFKGWIERVFVPGFAYKFDKPGVFPRYRYMRGKSVRVITTAGGYKWIYLITLNPPYMLFKFYFLVFCGFKPVRNTSFFGIAKIKKERLKKILNRIEELGKKGK